MKETKLNKRLSAIDAAFLYSETDETPMHIGGLEVVEGLLKTESLVKQMDTKLHLVPRYRQLLVPSPFMLGHPTWEDHAEFDINNHVETITLPSPGTEAQFQAAASEHFGQVLDRSIPLWKMIVIEGREDGNTGLLWMVHHAMVDGVSGAEILQVMFDIKADSPLPEKPEYDPAPTPERGQLMRDAAWDTIEDSFRQSAELGRKATDLARNTDVKDARERRREYPKLLRDLGRPLHRLPFNKMEMSGVRMLDWSYVSFAEVRGIRKAVGGTVNDVILTALAGGVRKYMEAHNMSTKRKTFRAACPVSLRTKDQSGALGNQVSMMPVDIDLDGTDPLERLESVSQRTALLKNVRIPNVLDLFSQMWQGTHPMFQSFVTGAAVSKRLTRLFDRFNPRPVAHMVCTNVPGPQVPLYAAGHQVLHHYPLLPVAPGMGLNMGVFSYNQRIYFGYIADQLAIEDVDVFRDCVDEAFVELREAAGVAEAEFVEIRHPKSKKAKGIDDATASEILEAAKQLDSPSPSKEATKSKTSAA